MCENNFHWLCEILRNVFKKLIEINAEVVGVVTKKESVFNADFVDLGDMCEENHIDCLYVKNINTEEAKDYMRQRKPDLVLCLGWSQILDQEILSIPSKGCIGFHPAQLPYNRGRHPLIWALVLGLRRTASTLFLMDSLRRIREISCLRNLWILRMKTTPSRCMIR